MKRVVVPLLVLATVLSPLPVPVPGRPADKPGLGRDELGRLLEETRAGHKLPAMAAGFVRADGQAVSAVVGVRKRGDNTPAGPDDSFHLGSNTKPLTALLLALLIDMGLLDWDTPLDRVFPDLANGMSDEVRQITPAMLATHRSGLPANLPDGWEQVPTKGEPRAQREWVLKKCLRLELEGPPGKDDRYSNLGYVLLGAAIDRAGKAPWEDQLARQVFAPLDIRRARHGALGWAGKVLAPWPHNEDGEPVTPGRRADNPPVLGPAGRVHMPPGDYTRFLAEVLRLARGRKGLLSPEGARKLFTSPYPKGRHCLGGWLGQRREGEKKALVLVHEGSNTLNYCVAVVQPEEDLAVFVCTNQGGDGARDACRTATGAILKRLKGRGSR